MALYVKQQNSRTELQERIAAELQEKLKTDKPLEYEKPVNSIEEGTHESQHLGPVVIMVTAVLAVAIAYLLLSR